MASRPRSGLYRCLLRAYPAAFRQRFGAEMLAMFQDRRDRSRGLWRVSVFWLRVIADFLPSVLRARLAGRSPAGTGMVRMLTTDIPGAGRALRRAPAGTLATLLLVTLTVGATSSVFMLVHDVLLAPLPFEEPDRVVMIWERRDETKDSRNVVGAHEFPEWQARARAFDHLAAFVYGAGGASLTGAGEPLALDHVKVTSGFFDVFGVAVATGRGFRPEEDRPGAAPVVIISHRLWRERFGGDEGIVGTSITINDVATTVVGVAPERFTFPPGPGNRPPDAWTPFAEPIQLYRGRHYLFVVGRLRADQSRFDAQAELDALTLAVAREFPGDSGGHGALVVPLDEELSREARPPLLALAVGVTLLALVGFVNLAGLGALRLDARRQDLRIRLALGAGRGRLRRQLAIEAWAVATLGGLAGLALAAGIGRALVRLIPPDVLAVESTGVGPEVLLVAGATSLIACGVLVLAAVVQVPADRSPNAWAPFRRLRSAPRTPRALLLAHVAVTVVLLAGALTLVEYWQRLTRLDLGFTADSVLAVDLALPSRRYDTAVRQQQFFDALTARIRLLPGVRHASTTSLLPLGGGRSTVGLSIEGQPAAMPGRGPVAAYRVVGAGYFETLGIPIIAGRVFTESDARRALPLIRWYPGQPWPDLIDAPQAPPVAVISQSMARQFWPGLDPLGRRFQVLFGPVVTVVGVVGDARTVSRLVAPSPELYLFDGQEPQGRMNLLVRTHGDPRAIEPDIRRVVRALDAELPIVSAAALGRTVRTELGLPRLTSLVTGAFALASVTLLAAGIYALVAFAVSMQRHEIGIRVALGARPATVRRLVAGPPLTIALAGLAMGWVAWMPAADALRSRFEGLDAASPLWPMAPAGAALLLAVAAATWSPLRRALRINPAVTLKSG